MVDVPVHAGMVVLSPSSSFVLLPGETRKVTVALTQTGGPFQNGIVSVLAHEDRHGGTHLGWTAGLRTGRK